MAVTSGASRVVQHLPKAILPSINYAVDGWRVVVSRPVRAGSRMHYTQRFVVLRPVRAGSQMHVT